MLRSTIVSRRRVERRKNAFNILSFSPMHSRLQQKVMFNFTAFAMEHHFALLVRQLNHRHKSIVPRYIT